MAPVRTLIVDDHAGARFLIRAIVTDSGADVEIVGEADGAEAALERLEALGEVDVVVLDARMPRVDGFEAAPLLLARRPGLVVVMCSAIVDEEVRSRAFSVGAVDVVSKDRLDSLPEAVLRAAGRG
jgi:two-component system, chemotaxis family, protein-glutamate methylesterase/glutaminase